MGKLQNRDNFIGDGVMTLIICNQNVLLYHGYLVVYLYCSH